MEMHLYVKSEERRLDERTIRFCFWIFLFFLIFEGSFRKWILPQFDYLFIVIKDPFVVYAVLLGIKHNLITSGIPKLMMFLGVINFLFAMIFGHHNFVVVLYGARILIVYFPFMYVCSNVLRRKDILLVGKLLVFMLIPMVIINICQFLSPQSAWINRAVGGGEGGGFAGGAMGYYRPGGIFPIIAALTDYYALAFCFLLYFCVDKKTSDSMGITKILPFCIIAYLISIPVSISRTHFFQSVIILFFYLFVALRELKHSKRLFYYLGIIGVVFTYIIFTNKDVQLFIEVFLTRYDGANQVEAGGSAIGAILDRTFGYLPKLMINDVPLFGYGDGYFTNVGLRLLGYDLDGVMDSRMRKIIFDSEVEWNRIVFEDGFFVGLAIICTRLYISVTLIYDSYKKYVVKSDSLPFMISSIAAVFMFNFQLKNGYNLGFTSLAVICCLCAQKQSHCFTNFKKLLIDKVFINEVAAHQIAISNENSKKKSN